MNKTLRYIAIATVFLSALAPVFFASSLFFPFITGKAYLFRILVEIGFASWVLLALWDKEYRPRFTLLTSIITAFTFFMLIADLFGESPLKSIWSNYERMEGWVMLVHLWAFFIMASSVMRSRKIWNAWFWTSLIISAVIGAWGVVQFNCYDAVHSVAQTPFCAKMGNSDIGQRLGGIQIMQGDRLNVTLGNAAYYAIYAQINAFLGALLAVRGFRKNGKGKKHSSLNDGLLKWFKPELLLACWSSWVAIIIAILNVWGLYTTATRGTMYGLIAGIISACAWYVAYYFWNLKRDEGLVKIEHGHYKTAIAHHNENHVSISGSKRAVIACSSVIIVLVILVGSFLAMRNTDFVKNNRILSRFANFSVFDTQNQARAYIYPIAIKGFLDNPILGSGQENFNYSFNKYYDPHMWKHEQWFDRAHSVFLDWLVAGGIFGFLFYCSLYVIALAYITKKVDVPLSERSIFFGLFVAYGIHNLAVFDNVSSYVLSFALLAYLSRERIIQAFIRKETISKLDTKLESVLLKLPNNPSSTYKVVSAIVCLSLFVVTIYFVNIRSIQANQKLLVAGSTCSANSPETYADVISYGDPISMQEVNESLFSCTRSILESGAPVELKQKMFNLTQEQIKEQLSHTPNDARIYMFMGLVYQSASQLDLAYSAFSRAHELSPNKQAFLLNMALILSQQGKGAESAKLYEQIYNLDQTYPTAKLAHATALVYQGKYADALTYVAGDKSIIENEVFLLALKDNGHFEDVIKVLQAKKLASPSDMSIRTALISVYLQMDDKLSAVNELNEIPKINPNLKAQTDKYIKDIWAGKSIVK